MQKCNKFFSIFLVISLILPIFSFTFTNYVKAADGDFVWVKQFAGTSTELPTRISLDSTGSIYTTGTFQGTVDFNPGLGTFNMTSAGIDDIFISKLDSSGNFVWAKQIGDSNYDYSNSITTDSSGNVYVVGYFSDTVDFDPGGSTFDLTSNGNHDIFILKLDSSGNFVWAKSMGGLSSDIPTYVTLDALGNVYTTGSFQGTVDFNPGGGTSNLTSQGNSDIFISKLDSSGDFVWVKSIGGVSFDTPYSIAVDSLNNVYTVGYFSDTVDFDPGGGTSNLISAGGADIFISKLDSSGNFVWAKKIGAGAEDIANSIVLDSSNNLYTTGKFSGTVDFDPGAGTFDLTSVGNDDIFISKLDSSGNLVWAKSVGGPDYDSGASVTLDSFNNVYVTGTFYETVDFDPGIGTFNLSSDDDTLDAVVLKLSSAGDFIFAKRIGGNDTDFAYSITTDSSDNLYTLGTFNSTVDFDPGLDTVNLTSVADSDIFILKLSTDSLDITSPVLSEVTGVGIVVNNGAINYTFNADEGGDITYGGSCSSVTTTAVVGNNTITLNPLSPGNYSNCTITVTDGLNNVSNVLTISPFDIVVHSGGGSSTSSTPVITTPVITTPTTPIQTPEPINTNPVNNNTNQNQTTLGNNKLCTKDLILTQNLKAGARDNRYHSYTKGIVKEVKILQAHMNRLNFNSGKVDGILGPITDGAIKRMQAYLGTTQDGLVGPITRDLINNSCN